MSLTDTQIGKLRRAGRHGAGKYGLAVNVHHAKSGDITRSWVQRVTVNGKRVNLGLGRWPIVDVARAERMALDNLRMALDGIDPRKRTGTPALPAPAAPAVPAPVVPAAPQQTPSEDRWQFVSGPTLAGEWASFVAMKEADGDVSAKVAKDWGSTFDAYLRDALGGRQVASIESGDVVAAINAIESPSRRKRTLSRLKSVLASCAARGLVGTNVAADVGAAIRNGDKGGHHAAVSIETAHDEYVKVLDAEVNESRLVLFQLVALTGCRVSEAQQARWADFDIEAGTWTIDASRTKTETEYVFALSAEAVRVLRFAKSLQERQGIASDFAAVQAKTGKPLPDSWPQRQRQRVEGIEWTHHGWRTCFAGWASREGYPREVIERQLQHAEKGVQACYYRDDLIERRREMVERWAEYLTGG
ncbi:tyrosine-type recombinase/integrase [Candidatus Poriferisodalis sp.]|uniref:tyrosine-type recombinase/integrase n=1 Tax=Candidatus Poriferisodalis sp. TaxID=3101277 RepID=UPI003B5D0302